MDPDWLSNAYLVWDEGTLEAFFVDSGRRSSRWSSSRSAKAWT